MEVGNFRRKLAPKTIRNKLTGGQEKSLDEAERLMFILRSNTACCTRVLLHPNFCIAVESNL